LAASAQILLLSEMMNFFFEKKFIGNVFWVKKNEEFLENILRIFYSRTGIFNIN